MIILNFIIFLEVYDSSELQQFGSLLPELWHFPLWRRCGENSQRQKYLMDMDKLWWRKLLPIYAQGIDSQEYKFRCILPRVKKQGYRMTVCIAFIIIAFTVCCVCMYHTYVNTICMYVCTVCMYASTICMYFIYHLHACR